MKKILSVLLAICMMAAFAVSAMADSVPVTQMQTKDIITITVDGTYVNCAEYGQLPVIVEGRTLVPLRSVFEALGATVEWDNATRSVKSVKGEVTIVLAVDSKEMIVNGEVKVLDVPAQIMNERTMVPVRAVAEAFGAIVEWNNETRTVVIKTDSEKADSNIPVVDINDAAEKTPVDVIKAAYDAMFALDFETCASYFKDPAAVMGEFAGAANISDITSMVAGGENLTEEQVVLIENFTKRIMNLVSYEITGMNVTDTKAEVYVTTYTPDFENMSVEEYLTEDAIALLLMEILAELGYSIEDMDSMTQEEEVILANALTAGMLEYIAIAFETEVENTEVIKTEEVEKLEKIDGKWLIVTE